MDKIYNSFRRVKSFNLFILIFIFVNNLQSPLKIVPFHIKLMEKKRCFSMTSLFVSTCDTLSLPSTQVAFYSDAGGKLKSFIVYFFVDSRCYWHRREGLISCKACT